MPQYAALLYYTEDQDWTDPALASKMGEYTEFGAFAGSAITGGAALFPTTTATTVTVPDGQGGTVVTADGPYAEAKEILGGFFLIEADDLDGAVALAARIPAAWDGNKVEVRPVVPL
jgi:hypothetical protein